jgi:hypothetical protein
MYRRPWIESMQLTNAAWVTTGGNKPTLWFSGNLQDVNALDSLKSNQMFQTMGFKRPTVVQRPLAYPGGVLEDCEFSRSNEFVFVLSESTPALYAEMWINTNRGLVSAFLKPQ